MRCSFGLAQLKELLQHYFHQKMSALKHYWEASSGKSNTEAWDIAADIISSQVDWDWDHMSSFADLSFFPIFA